jgi:hypothetical protein
MRRIADEPPEAWLPEMIHQQNLADEVVCQGIEQPALVRRNVGEKRGSGLGHEQRPRFAAIEREEVDWKSVRLPHTGDLVSQGLAVSPDQKTILFTKSATSGADLMMIENFH